MKLTISRKFPGDLRKLVEEEWPELLYKLPPKDWGARGVRYGDVKKPRGRFAAAKNRVKGGIDCRKFDPRIFFISSLTFSAAADAALGALGLKNMIHLPGDGEQRGMGAMLHWILPRLAAYVAVVVAAGLLFLAGASVYALMWPKPVVPFGQMGP